MTETAINLPAANNNQVVILGVLYSALLILSNLTAAKIVHLFNLNFTAALIFFPLTYIFDNILTEVYGFKMSRRVIWLGFFANTIVMMGALLVVSLPSAAFWQDQTAFATVFGLSFRVFIASTIAYLVGEFINSIILAKLKVLTQGKHLWLRAVSSTALGTGIDTTLFVFIAFKGSMPQSALINMIIIMYVFKLSYEIIALPITYKVAKFLKQKDNIDYYDTKTQFNPFSLKV